MSKIGDNIKKYRLLSGLTQQQVVDALPNKKTNNKKKTKNVVSNWENGQNLPDAESIAIMCGLFGIDANTLLGWDDNKTLESDAEHDAETILNNKELLKALPHLNKLSPEDLKAIISLAKNLIKIK